MYFFISSDVNLQILEHLAKLISLYRVILIISSLRTDNRRNVSFWLTNTAWLEAGNNCQKSVKRKKMTTVIKLVLTIK